MYRYILFDLDGTLTDSKPGIINSIIYALEYFDIDLTNKDGLTDFIGPPLHKSLRERYGFSDNDISIAVSRYREYFSDKGIFENSVYPGIHEMLEQIVHVGAHVYLATSKPHAYAVRILDHYNLSEFFNGVYGATMDGKISEKKDVISFAIRNISDIDINYAVMVGDRKYDILGAKENGIKSAGVLYGYGTQSELVESGADHIISCVQAIPQILNCFPTIIDAK